MADLGQAYVQIIPKAQGISGKISNLVTPGAKTAGEKAGKESGAGLAAGIKGTLAKLAIGATIGAGIKAALDEGGKLQQSYGGLETIYGDAAEAAKKYAVQASQAGISANSYAEQAVSFGASLRQAFGGDTTKAVESANIAILDMADNSAKMGTSLESIQYAYQGFAKQNYTMLDNLKLGYGGTKAEMERLLKDAQAITGVEYDMSNLGDVYEAIHVIQGELGLTGVAAAEASGTFTGSFGAMQAALSNLLGSLTTGGDVEGAMTTLLGSTSAFIMNNFLPMLGQVFISLPKALGTAFETAVPMISEKLPEMITTIKDAIITNAPGMIDSGLELIRNIADGIITNFPIVQAKAQELISKFGTKLVEYAPVIMEKGKELIVNLINGIANAIPGLLENGTQMLEKFVATLETYLPKLAVAGGEMLGTIAEAIIKNIPKIVSAVAKIAPRLWDAFWKLVDLAGKSATKMLDAMAVGIKNGISAIMPVIKNLVSKITKPLSDLKGKVKDIMGQVANKLYDTWNNIKTKATTLWNSIKKAITDPIEKAKELVSSAVTKIKSIFPISMGKIFSGVKLPHFKISGGQIPWGIGGQGTKPSVGIEWYKKGGIAKNPTLYGVGEKGNEAIVPLTNPYMRPFAEAIADQMEGSGNTYNINIDGAGDPTAVVDEIFRRVNLKTRAAYG